VKWQKVITQTIIEALDPSIDWGPLMDLSSDCGTLRVLFLDWEFHIDLYCCESYMPLLKAGLLKITMTAHLTLDYILVMVDSLF